MEIRLNEEQSKILINIALKDLLPKELERRKKEKMALEKEGGESIGKGKNLEGASKGNRTLA